MTEHKKEPRGKDKGRVTPAQFLADLNALCQGWLTEYRFYPGRRCAFDYANPDRMIAIEIEGGVWMSVHGGKSRHFTGSGASTDMKKYNSAEVRGWTILRYPDDNKRLSKKTVSTALRDVRAILTGIDTDGQRTLGEPTQARLLSEKLGMNAEQTHDYLAMSEVIV